MSSRDALAAGVAPAVTMLQTLWTRETDHEESIKTMRVASAAAVKSYFTDRKKPSLQHCNRDRSSAKSVSVCLFPSVHVCLDMLDKGVIVLVSLILINM